MLILIHYLHRDKSNKIANLNNIVTNKLIIKYKSN